MPLEGRYLPSASVASRDLADRYERSGGSEGTTLAQGQPVVILTSIGARTGGLRKTPLMRVEHEGRYVVVASKGGAPRHPDWYFNLRANPRVELQDGASKKEYRAREVTGHERSEWWSRAIAVWPYDEYQVKTDREFPLFVLEPVGTAGGSGRHQEEGPEHGSQ